MIQLREGVSWQRLGIEAGCWVGVNLVETISDTHATLIFVYYPSLLLLGFLSFPRVQQFQAEFVGSLEPATA